ncbi:MAG: mandelate racemase/muconate lactonizing enzyme family protein [Candidatus Latescibacteria bacterium]|jgi:galactonate dehydratase|nr:mandelate racemase/muconate lactonizing enzyme family protein [Candidatus Latescibacterota bacterium]
MKVTGIEFDAVHVNHRGDWVFVHVLTDEGVQGLGELRSGKNYEARVNAVRALGEDLKGKDPRNIESVVAAYTQAGRSWDEVCALSAVEQALWDLLGKSLGVPVYTLLGGKCRDEIRLYANINRATTDRSPEGFATHAAAAVADGFDAVKLAPFDGLPVVDSAKEAEVGIACMRAVRESIGPDVDLLVDCHSRFTVKAALEVADELRDINLFWFEQPTSEKNLQDCLKVHNGCGLTTAGAEQRSLRNEFVEVFENKSMHIIMPDVTVIGGLSELKKVADMAQAWGMPTAPHGPFGPITIAAGVQAMAASPGFLILEYGWGEVPWRSQLTLPHEQIVRGRIPLTDRPGLGCELNMDLVNEHRVAV